MRRTETIENERQREQERLDAGRTAQERNVLGQFATPPALATQIADYALELWKERRAKVRFLDPGIGTGAFYAALRGVFSEKLVERAVGVEIDPRFVKTAKALWSEDGLEVTEADFTTMRPPASHHRFNLVLTNPPYVRHHHLEAAQKEKLQRLVARRLGIRVSGLSGLYCYFLLLCHDWLEEDALALWLVPSEFMDVNYGAAIKEYLTERVTLLRIHRFHEADVQFDDALVTSAVVAFRSGQPPRGHRAEFSFGGTLGKPVVREMVQVAVLRDLRQKWSNHPAGAGNGRRTDPSAVALGDLFTIKRGIATGANEFFIVPTDEALARGLPRECLKPILPSPRYLRAAVIESGPRGYPQIEKPLALIACSYPEKVVRERYPQLWNYLEAGKRKGIHERYLTAGRSPWYSQEERPPAPFLCTYMGRNRSRPFRFLWNKSQATAANVYLMLYPKEPLATALRKDPQLFEKTFRFLGSIAPENFLGEGRVYGGGLFKIEPKELARLDADALAEQTGLRGLRRQSRLGFA